ncbi:MAG TPA: glycoside hydrolase family 3 C-terminal domain-containing protein [Acidimicrobiales bacterium]|nr:glycoside hydrolase family 3 C-terminal domain-containing protein [Acidimicrobiales bacterium]
MPSTPLPAVDDLTLEEKCRLLGGASTWRTHPIERVGIPAVKMSDGPNGVRGDGLGARRTPGVVIPVGIAVGATWNPALAAELGDLLGTESRRKGAHVLLAPTVNLQRTPIGGRVFECLSEDPELTARLAVPLVEAVQAHDVAVTVKHYVANDTEIDRMSVDVDVDDRVLRELYLRPFEATVTEADAWGIMSAYNQRGGEHCAASRELLTGILRDEWGFDGFVVSDWYGSHDTVASIRAGLTVPMPGPSTIYGERLQAAVEAGDVEEALVDAQVEDLLRLMARVKVTERDAEQREETVDDPAERALCRRAVIEGLVLCRNEGGTLPIASGASVAVIGPNAEDTRIMGGGSASLQALPNRSLLEALTDRAGSVVHEPGVRIDRLPPPLTEAVLRTPDGEPGLRVDYRDGLDPDSPIVVTDVTPESMLRFFGSTPEGVDPERFHVTVTGTFVPERTGTHLLSAVLTGAGRIEVGDIAVLDDPDRALPRGPLFFGFGSEEQEATIECEEGVAVPIRITTTGRGGYAAIRLGVRAPEPPDMLERAVAAARDADVAVVVVGTNDEWETEGEDRTSIALPGDQDELIRRVAEANPRTVVVVNAGSPVSMPWIDDVAAVLLAYFGGNELADGVTDVLLGDADPGGRLPLTYPKALEDTPAWRWYAPVDGVQHYGEGLLMGYRGFDAAGTEPLFPFGHGLSYGSSEWGEASLSSWIAGPGDGIDVTVPIRATGERAATVVVQAYLSGPDGFGRPPKVLAGFAKSTVEPGAEEDVVVTVPPEAFRRWDGDGWVVDEGTWEVVVAASATDVRQRLALEVG